jgi:hypothetical protein
MGTEGGRPDAVGEILYFHDIDEVTSDTKTGCHCCLLDDESIGRHMDGRTNAMLEFTSLPINWTALHNCCDIHRIVRIAVFVVRSNVARKKVSRHYRNHRRRVCRLAMIQDSLDDALAIALWRITILLRLIRCMLFYVFPHIVSFPACSCFGWRRRNQDGAVFGWIIRWRSSSSEPTQILGQIHAGIRMTDIDGNESVLGMLLCKFLDSVDMSLPKVLEKLNISFSSTTHVLLFGNH